MNDDRSLVPTGRIANSAPVPIALENGLAQAAQMLLILPPEGVAGRAQAMSQCLFAPASAVHVSVFLVSRRVLPYPATPRFDVSVDPTLFQSSSSLHLLTLEGISIKLAPITFATLFFAVASPV